MDTSLWTPEAVWGLIKRTMQLLLYAAVILIVVYMVFFEGLGTETVLAMAAPILILIGNWLGKGDSGDVEFPFEAATLWASDAGNGTSGEGSGSRTGSP